MSTRKFGTYATREEFLESEIRTLNHHIQSMIDIMKVMSMNKQDMSDEIERLKLKVETAVKAEREACAKVCEDISGFDENIDDFYSDIYAAAIRARGQG